MITDADVRRWTDALDLDIQVFQAWVWGQTGATLVPYAAADIPLVESNDLSVLQSIKEAVEHRIVTGEWPSDLNRSDYVRLFYRAFNASALLTAAGTMEDAAPGIVNQTEFPPPDPNDSGRFIRWLYIDLWTFNGAAFVQALAAGKLRETTQQGRAR